MSIYSIYHVRPRDMVSIARFLSWLPNLRPVLARRAILDGVAGQACLDDIWPAKGVMGDRYFVVGSVAAEAIVEAYRGGKLPLKEGTKIEKTTQAEMYARSPLRPPHHQMDTA